MFLYQNTTKFCKQSKMSGYFNLHNLVLLWIVLILVGLPLSPFLMSVGTIGILLQWIYQSATSQIKPWVFLTYPGARILPILFLISCLGMIWTSDFTFGFQDLRIKLPLLILPLTLSSYLVQINKKTRLKIENIFIASVFSSTLITIILFHQLSPILDHLFSSKIKTHDVREYCVFTSHIRMGLFVALSICMLWARNMKNWKEKIFALITTCFFLYFLAIIESFTGIIAVSIGAIFFLFRYSKIKLNNKQRWILWPSFSAILIFIFGYIFLQYRSYQEIKENVNQPLPRYTINGHPYDHSPENRQIENGYYVFRNICWQELQREWNKKSGIEFNSNDQSGAEISQTLIRYLTSKGLTKDSVGVVQLSPMDLKNIESGIPNFTYPDLNGITRRLNRFFFEFQMMKLGYPPNGHSLFQRFIYWKNALKIIQQHWIIGVGTGDVEQAIQEQYQLDSNGLNNHYQLRTHNQYLTLILTFGIFAWIFIPYLFYSLIKTSKRFSLIALIFTILLLLSFLSEDTLETQAGVTFAAFFSAWWLGAPLWTSEKWRPLSD